MKTDFYDAYWKSGLHTGEEWSPAYFRKVMGVFEGRGSVLDYGCGLGLNYQKALSAAIPRYLGADVSSVALDDLRQKGLEGTEIKGDGSIDVEAGSFSAAVCSEVMEHLFDPLAAAKELYRVLEPGGVLVATVPNFGYHAWRLMALIRARVPSEPEDVKKNRFNGVHIRYFNASTFRRLFLDAGFREVEITAFDQGSVWDIFKGMSYLAHISNFARTHLPGPLHLRFLQDLMPSLFAYRIRAVARK